MNSKPISYLALISQREALDARINAAREAECETAVGKIRELIKEFDLSILDLQEKVHSATRGARRRLRSTAPRRQVELGQAVVGNQRGLVTIRQRS